MPGRRGVCPNPGRSGASPRTVSFSNSPSAVQFSDDPPSPWTYKAGGKSFAAPGVSLTSRSTPATDTVRAGHSCAPKYTSTLASLGIGGRPVTAP